MNQMSVKKPLWWNNLFPWRALNPQLPVATLPENLATGLVVHCQGQYGWNTGNWVDGDPSGEAVHYGLDIIGWVGNTGPHALDEQSICCSTL